MDWKSIYKKEILDERAHNLFHEQRDLKRLDGWFLIKEIQMNNEYLFKDEPLEIATAKLLEKVVEELPLKLSDNSVFAGTQNDAFAKTYALINPNFKVETFEGYCDPVAVFDDIEPNESFTRERIDKVKKYYSETSYVKQLTNVYKKTGIETKEVAYFVEQVTGHVVADFRNILSSGIFVQLKIIDSKQQETQDIEKKRVYEAMKIALNSAVILANRYADIAHEKILHANEPEQKARFQLLENTLRRVPLYGSTSLFEAIQSYIILWEMMCIEQSPNPYAFSAGNVDRIFEIYRAKDNVTRDLAASLFKHLLVFFNVGDRSWAISQNLLLSGMDTDNSDMTSLMTYAIMDAYKGTNYPQPILSVKLHKNTPRKLYEEMGEFFFTAGKLTPSFFNDESLFLILKKSGVDEQDLPDYAVAGCQEPLIMGKDDGNTTNSWLNLGKVLELTLNDGCSLISGKKIGLQYKDLFEEKDPLSILKNLRAAFYKQLDYIINKMVDAANGCSASLSNLRVPFLSANMGGIVSGIDMRDIHRQGTKYNGSGCLIHGNRPC